MGSVVVAEDDALMSRLCYLCCPVKDRMGPNC